MQAIRTQYKGPTDTRGSRIIATSHYGRTTTGYDHALSAGENHAAAAAAHVTTRMVPRGPFALTSGELAAGEHAHVVAVTMGS
jgi:hypothetical protein